MKPVGYVALTHEFRKEDRRWTAYCKELGTATFGRSMPEADKRLGEAICLHLNTLEDVGERERFFREHGIEFHRNKPTRNIEISVPVDREVFVRSHIQPIPAVLVC